MAGAGGAGTTPRRECAEPGCTVEVTGRGRNPRCPEHAKKRRDKKRKQYDADYRANVLAAARSAFAPDTVVDGGVLLAAPAADKLRGAAARLDEAVRNARRATLELTRAVEERPLAPIPAEAEKRVEEATVRSRFAIAHLDQAAAEAAAAFLAALGRPPHP